MLERIGNILFIISGCLWAIELIPQLIRTIKTKKVEDISLFFLCLCALAYILFLIGCYLIKNWCLFLAHLVPFFNVCILLFLVFKYREYVLKKYKIGETVIKVNDDVSVKEIEYFLHKIGYKRPEIRELFTYDLRNTDKELKALNNVINVTARKNNKLIGYLRIVTDKSYFYYFTDVMVLPKYRNKGIGTIIITESLNYCKKNGFIKIFLTPAKGKETFYKKLGFSFSNHPQMVILGNKNEETIN